jgi:hypothetical protein
MKTCYYYPVEFASESPSNGESGYGARQDALNRRVAAAARAIADRGMTPTVARVRAALGGGSPNDLAPALKAWKESVAGAAREVSETSAIPVQIADLAQELWQRATVAAAVELKTGPAARAHQAETDEADALRGQVTSLRRELERESILYGELRAQAARHEAIARDALARVEASEARERKHLRDLGSARARIVELEAHPVQQKPPHVRRPRGKIPPRPRTPPKANARPTSPGSPKAGKKTQRRFRGRQTRARSRSTKSKRSSRRR